MSAALAGLARDLRDVPLARAAAIRLRMLGRRPGGAPNGILTLFYHHMRATERAGFAHQLRRMRDFGEIIDVSTVLRLLAEGPIDGRYVCLTFDDGYRSAFDHAVPVLTELGVPATFFIVAGWLDQHRDGVIGWEECRALAASGIEIGSHALTHRRLAELSAAEVTQEFAQSKARIEAELGRPCLHFACPWGQSGADFLPEREPALARAAGYRCFMTTHPRRAMPGADPWSLPRVRMEPGWGDAELRYAFSR